MPSRVEGTENGADWIGILEGSGGRDFGVGRTFRGASLKGSTLFLCVVKTSGYCAGLL